MQNKYVAIIVTLGAACLIIAFIYTLNTRTISSSLYVRCSNELSGYFPILQLNESYICASVGEVYKLPAGNFSFDSIMQNIVDITIHGYCGVCARSSSIYSPPVSYHYVLHINQTADTACATGSELELIALNSAYSVALFKESIYSGICM